MISYRIKMTFDRPADFSRGHWRNMLAEAMELAGKTWHEVYLQKHFQQPARGRYGYQPRTAGWQKRKLRALARGKAVGAMDLVFSGQAREAAMKPPLIKAFPSRVRVDLVTPPYVQMRPKKPTRPNLGQEMTRVVYEESAHLATVVRDHLEHAITHWRKFYSLVIN